MNLKKSLKSKRAQAAVEYVTIFLIVLGLLTAFLNGMRTTLQAYHEGMINRIATQ